MKKEAYETPLFEVFDLTRRDVIVSSFEVKVEDELGDGDEPIA